MNPKDTRDWPLVYVAGPYTAREMGPHKEHPLHDAVRVQTQNVERAIQEGLKVLELGAFPFIPHLTHYVHLAAPQDYGELYYEWDNRFLYCCNFLYLYGHSPGADREAHLAEVLGKPIAHNLEELKEIINEWHKERRETRESSSRGYEEWASSLLPA